MPIEYSKTLWIKENSRGIRGQFSHKLDLVFRISRTENCPYLKRAFENTSMNSRSQWINETGCQDLMMLRQECDERMWTEDFHKGMWSYYFTDLQDAMAFKFFMMSWG